MKQKMHLALIASILIISTSLLLAGGIIKKFECKDGGDKVILVWTSTAEVSLDRYELERSLDNKTFNRIARIKAKGPSDYKFIDKSVFKQISHTFYYRLKLIDKDGSTTQYGKVLSIKPSISGVKHTWGSLKAMFR